MKILTIFTGGTIGSHIDSEGYISTGGDSNYMLLDMYRKKYESACEEKIEFLTEEPYTILSENLKAEHLVALSRAVGEGLLNPELSGIIVTHGTDTLQYSAAVLQYIYGDSSIPILLVSSDFVLTDERANGPDNFAAAVDFIKGGYGKGVFVSYKNPGEYPTIHRGTRMQNAVSYSANVTSVLDSWYGRFEESGYVANPKYKVNANNSSSMFPLNKEKVQLEEIADHVLRIRPYPGMKYPDLETAGPIKAVLHESYHSGTICIDENLRAFAEKAKEMHIPVFLTGLTDYEAEYETVRMYREMGLIPLTNCATIAQYCKIWLAADNNKEVISAMGLSVGEDMA